MRYLMEVRDSLPDELPVVNNNIVVSTGGMHWQSMVTHHQRQPKVNVATKGVFCNRIFQADTLFVHRFEEADVLLSLIHI